MVVNRGRSSRLIVKQCARVLVFALALTVLWSRSASADVLFEGYSKVLLDGVHVGYVIQRYEFDAKKKEFVTAYYLKTNPAGGNITESLKARSSATMRPVAYQFTELVGDHAKIIDAQFKGEQMTAVINDGGKKQTLQKKIPKNAFLSSFLAYVMLQGKEGIKKGNKYTYQAVAEEDGNLYSGDAFISGEETVSGINAFKVLNTFKGTQFISYCTFKGEVVATKSPVQKITTELVAGVQEATKGLSLNSNALVQLFGSVPKGMENPVARRGPEAPAATAPADAAAEKAKKLEATPPPGNSPKTEGMPGGQGVMIKGVPPQQTDSAKENQQ